MKTLFIEAKSKVDIIPAIEKIRLSGKIGLISTIQFLNQLSKAKKILKNSLIGGQILGCNIEHAKKIEKNVDAFLFIGSGKFHPLGVALRTKKPVYALNPYTNEITLISKDEISKYKKKVQGKILKFLHSKKIGILVSTKPGQYNIDAAIKLKKQLKKEAYIFLFDDLNLDELENFPDIGCWVNTACPRIEYKNLINMEDLPK